MTPLIFSRAHVILIFAASALAFMLGLYLAIQAANEDCGRRIHALRAEKHALEEELAHLKKTKEIR